MPTLTITATAPQATRISPAIGRLDGLRDENGAFRGATVAEVEKHLREYLHKQVVHYEEVAAREAAAAPTPLNLT